MNKLFLYIKSGIFQLFKYNPYKWLFILAYVLVALLLWNNFTTIFDITDKNILFTLVYRIYEILFITALIIGLFIMLAIIGKPFGSFFIHYRINNIGLTNCKKQAPILVSRYKDKNKQNGVIFKFKNFDIPIEDFEKKSSALGQA